MLAFTALLGAPRRRCSPGFECRWSAAAAAANPLYPCRSTHYCCSTRVALEACDSAACAAARLRCRLLAHGPAATPPCTPAAPHSALHLAPAQPRCLHTRLFGKAGSAGGRQRAQHGLCAGQHAQVCSSLITVAALPCWGAAGTCCSCNLVTVPAACRCCLCCSIAGCRPSSLACSRVPAVPAPGSAPTPACICLHVCLLNRSSAAALPCSAGVMVSAGFCHLLGEALRAMPKIRVGAAAGWLLVGAGWAAQSRR